MLIAYARTSTIEQKAGFDAQVSALKLAGCEEFFTEQVSAVQVRGELERALKFARKGDVLVVTKLDRLARSIPDMVRILGRLEEKQAALRILDMNLDTHTPTGRLLLNLIGSISQFEREQMLERQREGIAKAKSEGKYRGRKPTAKAKADDVILRNKNGEGASEIARSLGIGRASVYRILKETS